MVAMMCGLMFPSTGMVSGVGGVVVLGEVGLVTALLPAREPRKDAKQVSPLLEHYETR